MVSKHIKRCLISLIIQFSSVAQTCLTLCDPMDCSMPGFPVLHHLPELAQIHVHTHQDGYYKKKEALVKTWRNWSPYTSPGGMSNGAAIVKNCWCLKRSNT